MPVRVKNLYIDRLIMNNDEASALTVTNSADESFVYNPTLINVSFRDYVKDPEKIYTVKSGETLTLK